MVIEMTRGATLSAERPYCPMTTTWTLPKVEAIVRKALGLADGISHFVAAAAFEKGRIISVPKGNSISLRTDTEPSLYLLLSGSARISVNTAAGREFLVVVFEPGSMWGLRCCLDLQPNYGDVSADTDADVLVLTGANLRELMRSSVELNDAVVQFLCARVRTVSEGLIQFAVWSSRARLASRLLALVRSHGFESEIATVSRVAISQESLAAMIGTSRQRINKLLKDFEAEGMIRIEYNMIVVTDAAALQAVLDDD